VQGLEQAWAHDFANPLVASAAPSIAACHRGRNCRSSICKRPQLLGLGSSDVLEDVDRENRKLLEERRNNDERLPPGRSSRLLSTLIALAVGIVIAYRTAAGITRPLGRLIHVADQIGQSGDLEHNIDIRGTDEIGQLARTFDSMVRYLKEMAAVSEAIAGGNLAVEVRPRSANDTLANAFTRMVEGLRGMVRHVRDAATQVARRLHPGGQRFDESAKTACKPPPPSMK